MEMIFLNFILCRKPPYRNIYHYRKFNKIQSNSFKLATNALYLSSYIWILLDFVYDGEEILAPILSICLQIVVIHNTINGKPRGYAFIEYEHERDMHCK